MLRPRPEYTEDDCLYIEIAPLQREFDDSGESATIVDCTLHVSKNRLDASQNHEFLDVFYSVELPQDFVSKHRSTLLSGITTACIHGGEAVRSDGKQDRNVIVIPQHGHIEFVFDHRAKPERQLQLRLQSPRSVLVVRVLGDSGGEQPSESRERLAAAVFGIGSEPFSNSMRAQFKCCSLGQLDFTPATGYTAISNGVLDVRLTYSLQDKLVYSIRDDVRAEAARLLGVNSLETKFDHVMFCVAPGTNTGTPDSWTGFATRPGYQTFFSSGSCDKLSELMRQIGHNINLVGSSSEDDRNCDLSGMVRLAM